MRFETRLVLCLLLAVGVAGCGGSDGGDGVATAGGTATPSSSAGAGKGSVQDAMLKYSRCMRDNGVPNFPDPNENGSMDLDLDKVGVSKETVDAAAEKCKQYAPGGGEPRKPDPQAVEGLRQYAKCMRENGVPNFPDPDENGGISLDAGKLGVEPQGPTMKAAEQACEKFMPGGAGRSNNTSGGNG